MSLRFYVINYFTFFCNYKNITRSILLCIFSNSKILLNIDLYFHEKCIEKILVVPLIGIMCCVNLVSDVHVTLRHLSISLCFLKGFF